jgi:predicted F0F1-ATPase subunit
LNEHELEDGTPDEIPAKEPLNFWRLVAVTSSLGWSLVLPIVAGAFLGNYLDEVTGSKYIWTVGLLFAGVALSLYNLYHILYKETIE